MASGEITVDLRLKLRQLQSDISKATRMMREGFGKSLNVGGGGGDLFSKASTGAARLRQHMEGAAQAAVKVAKATKAVVTDVSGGSSKGAAYGSQTVNLLQQRMLDAGGGNLATTFKPKPGIGRLMWSHGTMAQEGGGFAQPSMPAFMKNRSFSNIPQADRAVFFRNMGLGMAQVMRPGSMWSNIIGSRGVFSAMSGTRTGAGVLGKMGMGVGAGGAAVATAGITVVLLGLGVALKIFKEVLSGASRAIKSSFGLVTGAGQAGLGTSFYARRQAMAQMLGVQGNPNEVFKMGASIGPMMRLTAPAIAAISKNAPALAELVSGTKLLKLNFEALGSQLAITFAPAIKTVLQALNGFAYALMKYSFIIKQLIDPTGIMGYVLKKFGNMSKGADFMGPMKPFMNQLPASTWEKMGLVIGGGGKDKSLEYQRRTATTLEKIHSLIGKGAPVGRNPSVNTP